MATPPSFAPVPADIDTVPRLFRHAVATRGDAVMLRQKEQIGRASCRERVL